jgi:5'(3')-deoxyribonucleotidase
MNVLKTIAWDIDDVLNDLMASWFDYWKKGKACGVRYEDLKENPPGGIIGISVREYLASLDEFRLSSLYQEMPPLSPVVEWFKRNGRRYRHVALTAVPFRASAASAQWVLRNFGTWVRTFHFVPSPRRGERLPVYDENKAAFIEWIDKVDVFIDDNPEQIRAADRAGVRTFLFPRPWNDGEMRVEELLGELERL